MQILFEQGHKSSYEYPDQHFYLRIPWKTTDFAKNSSCHRTTIAHFLNSGKWNDSLLSDTLKQSVIEIIYSEAARTGNPVFYIVDDTIASKTKPLSRALHPIEDAYFHQSHLKKKQDYGHQAVAVILSCNGIVLNYAFVMYNNSGQHIKSARYHLLLQLHPHLHQQRWIHRKNPYPLLRRHDCTWQ